MFLKPAKIFFALLLLSFAPATAWAFDCNAYKAQFQGVASNAPVFCSAGSLLSQVFNILLAFAGVAAVIFIIIGGFWFITSSGNEERAEKGRKTLINSIIGLAVIILAATIVRVVVNTLGSTAPSNSAGTTSSSSSGNNSGNSNNTNNGGTGNNPTGNVLNDVGVNMSNPTSGNQNYTFTATVPTSDSNALTELCNSSNYTFTVMGTKNTLYGSQANFAPSGSSLTATVTVSAGSFTTTPDTVKFSVCGQALSATGYIPAGFSNGGGN